MDNLWIFLVLIYALLKGGREGMKKAAVKKSGTNEILFLYTFVGFLMTIPYYKAAFSLSGIYIFYSFIKAACCCVAWMFSLFAIKRMSVSLYGVMDLSRMVFSTLLGIIVLGEDFTTEKAIGMVLVITGLLLVNAGKSASAKGITFLSLMAVLLNCFFNAISGVMDKILMKNMGADQLQFWFMFFMSLIYGVVLFIRKEQVSFKTLKTNYWILLMSISLVLGDKLLFVANSYPQSQVTLMTLIKQSAVIVPVLTGWLIFKEKNILRKLLCTLIIIAGIMIPLVFS